MRIPIKAKLLIMLLLVAIPAVGIVGWLGYKEGKIALEESIFNELTSVRAAKARQIESYFRHVRNQAQTFSESRMIINAMTEFSAAFEQLSRGKEEGFMDQEQEAVLQTYYASEFLPRLHATSDDQRRLQEFLPQDPATQSLQSAYIVHNPHPLGAKDALDDSGNGMAYDRVHAKYHPLLRNFKSKFGYFDVFLVDESTGHVVYSVFKETDFGTSLLNGPYRDTNIAAAFRDAASAPSAQAVKLVDYELYSPSYGAPAAFIASPIFNGTRRLGVLVFQLPADEINRIMTGDRNWPSEGLGESGETYLVGPDHKMRSVSRFLIEKPDRYFSDLKKIHVPQGTIQRIRTFGTSILLQEVNTHASREALQGRASTSVIPDYRGIPVLSSYAPLAIDDVQWVILSEIDEVEALAPIKKLEREILILAVFIILAVLAIAILFAQLFVKPINALAAGAHAVAQGDLSVEVKTRGKDEIAEFSSTFNNMVANIRESTRLLAEKNKENERLLLNILPASVASRLKGGETSIADGFQEASVLFADLVGFTQLSNSMTPDALVQMLNDLFSRFDRLMLDMHIEKIKTIGDCYMAVCGVPNPNKTHPQIMGDAALQLVKVVEAFNEERGTSLQIRIGLNCGPVVAGVIGASKFIYDLWGDTVNLASRMESAGLPNTVQVTQAMYEALRDSYELESRGLLEIKGKGMLPAYILKKRCHPFPSS
jgi:class 3 adenylate cyclase